VPRSTVAPHGTKYEYKTKMKIFIDRVAPAELIESAGHARVVLSSMINQAVETFSRRENRELSRQASGGA